MGFGLVTGEIGESGAANALRGVRLLGSLAYLGRSERARAEAQIGGGDL